MKREKPLTLNQLADYATGVLLPAIDSRMNRKISNLKKELLAKDDKIISKLDKLNTENIVRNYQEKNRNYQEKKQKKFFGIMVRAIESGKATSEQLEEISKLNVL